LSVDLFLTSVIGMELVELQRDGLLLPGLSVPKKKKKQPVSNSDGGCSRAIQDTFHSFAKKFPSALTFVLECDFHESCSGVLFRKT
jgi:hypothetical protein